MFRTDEKDFLNSYQRNGTNTKGGADVSESFRKNNGFLLQNDYFYHDDEDDDFDDDDSEDQRNPCRSRRRRRRLCFVVVASIAFGCAFVYYIMVMTSPLWYHKYGPHPTDSPDASSSSYAPKWVNGGPYALLECQQGRHFWDYYQFFNGPDSLGSAGYNNYVGGWKRASDLGVYNVTTERDPATGQMTDFIYISSAPTPDGPRNSIRLEGERRFDRGLYIMDLQHMPAGCGVWPAFWLTDEEHWPDHGEIDIVEGINTQQVAKTALHTSRACDMYAHVPPYAKTGVWDTATGIPDTFTGQLNYETRVEADNCWTMAPHQWQNQGCVTVHTENGTIGSSMNENGGGVYVLEWDPENKYIKSWVFRRQVEGIPLNLQQAMATASSGLKDKIVRPDPSQWDIMPYAYFAIGDGTGCSADHFQNMRIVINLAFCGAVAGNRFVNDCPAEAAATAAALGVDLHSSSPVELCNAYIKSNPTELSEAYWKIRGVYVYERELVKKT